MKYLIVLFSFLIFSCSHKVPIANIEFIKIEKNFKYENSYFLYFESDIELIENLQKEYSGGLTMKCFFLDKIINKYDFSDYEGYYLQSIWNESELVSKTSKKYIYKVKATFYESDDVNKKIITKGVSQIINEGNINCLSCAATAINMFNVPKRYISNTMCISKEELKKVIK